MTFIFFLRDIGFIQLTSSHFIPAGFYKLTIPQYPPSHLKNYSKCKSDRLEFPTDFLFLLNEWWVKYRLPLLIRTQNISDMSHLPRPQVSTLKVFFSFLRFKKKVFQNRNFILSSTNGWNIVRPWFFEMKNWLWWKTEIGKFGAKKYTDRHTDRKSWMKNKEVKKSRNINREFRMK